MVESPDRLFWVLSFGVHLQPVKQESWGSLMIFDIRTSRCSEDMNKTYSPSDHRPKALRVSNEIWGVISIHALQKNPFVSKCDAAWKMYDIYVAWPGWLSRVQLWLWQSKLRQVRQTSCALNGKESEWTSHYQPGTQAEILCDHWLPSVYQLIKHHVCRAVIRYMCPVYFTHTALSDFERLFFFSTEMPVKRLDSTVQLSRGITECATTPPTQSWSCKVFKMDKQSQSSRVGLQLHAGDRGFSFE